MTIFEESLESLTNKLDSRHRKMLTIIDTNTHPRIRLPVELASVFFRVCAQLLTEIFDRYKKIQNDNEIEKKRNEKRIAVRRKKIEQIQKDGVLDVFDKILIQSTDNTELIQDLAMSQKDILYTGALFNLYNAAVKIANNKDVEALNLIGETYLEISAKWLFKLSPVRLEDLKDFGELINLIQDGSETFRDISTISQTSSIRKNHTQNTSSLLYYVDSINQLTATFCYQSELYLYLTTTRKKAKNIEKIVMKKATKRINQFLTK